MHHTIPPLTATLEYFANMSLAMAVHSLSLKGERSVDILEECLDLIHRSRKNSLNHRAKLFNARMERKRSRLRSESRMRSSNNDFSAIDPSISRKILDAEMGQEDYDNEDEENGTKANPALLTFPSSMSTNRVPPSQLKLSTSMKIKTDFVLSPSNAGKSLPSSPDQHALTTANQKDDVVENGCRIFLDFRDEIVIWFKHVQDQRRHGDGGDMQAEVFEEYADYLTEKYMCQKLDPLPPSPFTSKLRKQIYQFIESIASSSYEDATMPENFSCLVLNRDGDLVATSSSSDGQGQQQHPTTSQQRRRAEKEKIQAMYERQKRIDKGSSSTDVGEAKTSSSSSVVSISTAKRVSASSSTGTGDVKDASPTTSYVSTSTSTSRPLTLPPSSAHAAMSVVADSKLPLVASSKGSSGSGAKKVSAAAVGNNIDNTGALAVVRREGEDGERDSQQRQQQQPPPVDVELEEYEKLNNDIRGLLSSLQKTNKKLI